jgi:hypothetical protein
MSVYIVEDDYTGKREIYKDPHMAEKQAQVWAKANHVFNCVEKRFDQDMSNCLCVTSEGKRECAAHHYRRTVEPHSLEECTLGVVSVEQIEIY